MAAAVHALRAHGYRLALSQQTAITAGQSWGQIEHTAPYARYVYYGEVYGPNYPIFQAGQIVGWYSSRGRAKHPTGRKMQYNRSLHPISRCRMG